MDMSIYLDLDIQDVADAEAKYTFREIIENKFRLVIFLDIIQNYTVIDLNHEMDFPLQNFQLSTIHFMSMIQMWL